MSVCITESPCCTPETNTPLQINCTSIKWKWKDRDSQNASGIRSSVWFVYCLLPPLACKIHVGRNCVSCTLKVLVAQSCPTLCNPMDCSPLCSSVHGILQARVLEWVAIPCSRGSSWPRDWTRDSCIAEDALPSEPHGEPSVPAQMILKRISTGGSVCVCVCVCVL